MERHNFRVSACTEALSVVSLALAIVTVVSPYWGRFSNDGGIASGELVTGYFGLWTICKDLPQGRSVCGLNVTSFNLTTWTFIAGVIAIVSVVSLGVASVVGVCLLLMLKTQERVCLPYRPSVVTRLVLSAFAALLSVVAIALASIPRENSWISFTLTKGWTFYVHILVIVSEILQSLAAIYDFVLSRRLGGDPTFYSRDPTGSSALTYSNPSFNDDGGRSGRHDTSSNSSLNSTTSKSSIRSQPNGNSTNSTRYTASHKGARSPSGRHSPNRSRTGRLANGSMDRSRRGSYRSRGGNVSKHRPTVAVTSTSGKPYPSNCSSSDTVDHSNTSILNGSFGSIESSVGNSSIVSESSVSSNPMALSPRKSSLKKPRPLNDIPGSPIQGSADSNLGFHNPGFSEPRIGSIKRVRIASQSTDV